MFPGMGGPDVLMVHGFGTSFAATWLGNGWVDLLAEAGRTVIGVDLLGHGESPKPSDPEAYRDLEDRILESLPDEPVDAIGFSAGAMAILWLAAQHPARFHRIVVAGVGRNLFESDPTRGATVVEAVRTGEADNPELRYFADLPEAAGADRAALTAFLTRPDRRVFSAELLNGVTVPVQVVLGDRDFAGPADLLVEALPDATHVTLRGVDHFATPRDFGFIDAALGFLDAQPF
jgi:pimeloyl-ACP methyl ester carboxylesterase|tara:strand:+ start:1776 stop:2474 length:699 start_codon:yes stop_codon:yes gene_type:complete